MASIRRGYSDDFVIKNSGVGINTTEPQQNLDVDGVVKGQDLKVTGVSSFTAYEGFLRADHQIVENTTLTFDQGPVSSLSGEIIVGSGVTVTIDNLPDGEYGPELITNGTFDSDTTGWTAFNAVISSTGNQLKVDDTANAGGWSSASQEIKTEPGAKYRWEVTVGSTTDGSFIGYNAGKYTAGNTPTEVFGQFSGGQTTAIEFIAPEKITTIVLVTNNDGVSYYDNVSLKKINVAEEPRAGGSEIECLKVFNTFTPPNGGTNERPYAPKPGELYYNYDFKTIEFFDGNGWRQVDNTTRSGRAVFGGGTSPNPSTVSNVMEYIQISTFGNALDFGDLVGTMESGGGCSSSTRGLFSGGRNPGQLDRIDYITIGSAGNAIDFGNLTDSGRIVYNAVSSSTRGVNLGGYKTSTSANINTIDYVELPTLGDALDFGDVTTTRRSGGDCSSPTRGIYAGGYGAGSQSVIESLTISSKGNTIRFGELTFRGYGQTGCSSTVRGVFAGGNQDGSSSGYRSETSYITIASEGNATYFGDLAVARATGGAASNSIRGVFAGGYTPTFLSSIETISISEGGSALDFGDLSAIRRGFPGVSDSHGGLGGF